MLNNTEFGKIFEIIDKILYRPPDITNSSLSLKICNKKSELIWNNVKGVEKNPVLLKISRAEIVFNISFENSDP